MPTGADRTGGQHYMQDTRKDEHNSRDLLLQGAQVVAVEQAFFVKRHAVTFGIERHAVTSLI
jgi:hypothetical protein